MHPINKFVPTLTSFSILSVFAMAAASLMLPLRVHASVLMGQPVASTVITLSGSSINSTAQASSGGTINGLQYYYGDTGTGSHAPATSVEFEIVDQTSVTTLCTYSGTGVPLVSTALQLYSISGTQLGTCNGATLTNGHNYTIQLQGYATGFVSTGQQTYGSSSTSSSVFWQLYDTPPPAPITTTQITSLVPPDGTTIATSSAATITASGYVASSDYVSSNTSLRYTLTYQTPEVQSEVAQLNVPSTCLVGIPGLFCLWSAVGGNATVRAYIPITASGIFSNVGSTTVPILQPGRYSLETAIVVPSFSILGFDFGDKVLVSTSTTFIADQETAYDKAVDVANQNINNLASTTANSLTGCTVSSFDLSSCIYGVLVPDQASLSVSWNSFHDSVLEKVPWGYITRFSDIVASTSVVEPPGISYTFGSSSPAILQGDTFSYNVFDHFDIIPTIKADDGSNKDIYDIVDPYFTMLVSLSVLFVILSDLIGFDYSEFNFGNEDLLSGKEKRAMSNPTRMDNRGRTASERRRVIAERGSRHDASGGRGIIH